MMRLRLVAIVIVAALAAAPLTILPSPFLAWLSVPAFVVGGAGVAALSVPLVTVGASLALIEYAGALAITAAPVDVVTATALGATLFLLLELVHLAGRTRGAVVGRSVIATQVRHWLAIVAVGMAASVGLVIVAMAVRLAASGTSVPLVIIASAVGAVLTMAGVLARVTASKAPDDTATS